MLELLGDHFMIMQEAWELLEYKYQQLIQLSAKKSTVVVPLGWEVGGVDGSP